jgi:hypothetical protein
MGAAISLLVSALVQTSIAAAILRRALRTCQPAAAS